MEDLRIRPAGLADLDTVVGLVEQAAAWLRTKDTDQWQRPWPTLEGRNRRILRGLEEGETWLVEAGGETVATATCNGDGNRDRLLWTERELSEPTAFVSRLVVRRDFAGLAIGAELIDWAGQYAVDRWGARWIRIDVWTTNHALHNYYENQGFEFLRFCETPGADNPSAALFQKSTEKINPVAAARFVQSPPVAAAAVLAPAIDSTV